MANFRPKYLNEINPILLCMGSFSHFLGDGSRS